MVKPKFAAVNNWRLLEDDIVAALQSFQCPLWVIGGHFAMRGAMSALGQKQTCAAHKLMSAKCQ
jgi:hypothetical protein